MKLPFLMALIVLLGSSITRACLNDRDVLVSEREFRSEYLDRVDASDDGASQFHLGWIATGAGAFLTAASAVVLRRSGRDFPYVK